jgi:GntR family transcriptional regulator
VYGAVVRPFELEEALAERITAGELRPGQRMTDRELARDHDVGRLGARQVLAALSRRGLVELRENHEAVVSRPKVEHDLRGIAGFSEQMEAAGLEPAAKLISAVVVVAPPKVHAALRLEPHSRVAKIERIRYASKVALALEETWLPDALYPDITDLGLRDSLYALMRDCYGRGPVRAVERLEAVPAREQDAERLKVPVGAPLMLVERTTFDEDGVPIEFARDRFRGDRARFVSETIPRVPV